MKAIVRAFVVVAFLLVGPACSMNPVTRKPEVVFVSEEQEIAAGAEGAEQVQAEMGLVEDARLVSYVEAVGQRLAAHSPRAGMDWRFAIVDLDPPNAFALPGGWVYVSRGVLQLANSEDELANVIAHELVHVAARHHAQRHARATGLGILALPGLLAGALIPGVVGDLVSAPFAVAGVGLIARYSRDQEREADRVGQQIAAQAGYDPSALGSFLDSLTKDMALRAADDEQRAPSWLDSHPSPGGRAADAAKQARSLAFSREPPIAGGREGFLRRIEGVLVGENPAEGIFEGQRFVHPDLGLTLVFPEGWTVLNTRSAVGALSEARDAQVVLQHAGHGDDPREAASLFFEEASKSMRVDVARLDSLQVNGLAAVRGQAVAGGGGKTVSLDLAWISLDGSIYQIAGAVAKAYTDRHRTTFGEVIGSFRRLSPAERSRIQELRLRLREARAGDTPDSFGRRTGSAWTPEQTAVFNALPLGARLPEARLLKVALRQPYAGRPVGERGGAPEAGEAR
jgi:predicted Zn-dependent protease